MLQIQKTNTEPSAALKIKHPDIKGNFKLIFPLCCLQEQYTLMATTHSVTPRGTMQALWSNASNSKFFD